MGISEDSKGVRVYWPATKTVTTERNIYYDKTASSVSCLKGEEWDGFVEMKTDKPLPKIEPLSHPVSTKTPIPDAPNQSNDPKPIENRSETDEDQSDAEIRPKRVRKPAQRVKDILIGKGTASNLPKGAKIAAGVNEELATLKEAGTWELVDTPQNANIVGYKWVFRAKKDAAGHVVRYKARLLAQGSSQVPGVDYLDTFAPVARLASIRAVLAIAAVENLKIHQIDIKGAYLNGVLNSQETIYMRQPPGYSDNTSKVCRLIKTLYGLKQSGRRWLSASGRDHDGARVS